MLRRFYTSIANHYSTLELSPGATHDEIKQAYKRLVKKYHPDSTKIADKAFATEKFKMIYEAKTILLDKDPEKHVAENQKQEEPPSYNIYRTYEDFKRAHERQQKYQERERQHKADSSKGFQYTSNEGKNTWSADGLKGDNFRTRQSHDPPNEFSMLFLFVSSCLIVGYFLFDTIRRKLKNLIFPKEKFIMPKSEQVAMGLKDPFTGEVEKPLYFAFEYLYKGQSGPHKRFLMLTMKDDDHALFKCKTCDAVITKVNLESHVLQNRVSHSTKK